MSIKSELLRLSQTPAFQKRVQTEAAAAKKAGRQFGIKSTAPGIGSFDLGIDEAACKERVNEIIALVEEIIISRLPSMKNDMFRVYGPFEAANGRQEYRLFFKPEVVHRESLYHEGYPDGLENIVLLYSHGSKVAKNPVWNRAAMEWDYNTRTLYRKQRKGSGLSPYTQGPHQHGEYRAGQHYFIPGGWQRDPDPFLTWGVDVINRMMSKDNVTVTLAPAYYP